MIHSKKTTCLFLCSLLLSLSFCFAQEGSAGKKTPRKALQYERKADIYFFNSDFQNALALYQQAYEMDTASARLSFKTGACMYNLKRYKHGSLPFFEKALRGGVSDANYYLGNLYLLDGKMNEAIHSFEEYKKNSSSKKPFRIDQQFSSQEVDVLIEKCKTAEEMVHHPVNVKIENMGNVINSEFPDYVPVISADESLLLFTSRRKESTGNQPDPNGDYFEDVYVSRKMDSAWSVPKSVSNNINTPTHDACVGLSADGELLFLYRTSENVLSGDLYSSVFNGQDWTVPAKLPAPINSAEYNEPSIAISADGQTIYFSSNRPGGFGNKDIYRVVKLDNGEWSKAVNLGPSVNTSEEEDAPFIHPDGKTLYFSSQRHKNMGGFDIFKTILSKGDSWDKDVWSKPENLGYPINTTDDDIFFVISSDGKRGYYSSTRADSYGGTDIYIIHFPEEKSGLNVFIGKVASADSAAKPLRANITLREVSADSANKTLGSADTLPASNTNRVEGIYATNPLTGRFIMILSDGKEYIITAESEGYAPYRSKIQPPCSEEVQKIILHQKEK